MLRESLKGESIQSQKARESEKIPQIIHDINVFKDMDIFIQKHQSNIIIVKFYSENCSLCKAYTPLFEEFHEKYGNDFYFVQSNVEDDLLLSYKYKISELPTTLIFREGIPCYKRIGPITHLEMDQKLGQLKK